MNGWKHFFLIKKNKIYFILKWISILKWLKSEEKLFLRGGSSVKKTGSGPPPLFWLLTPMSLYPQTLTSIISVSCFWTRRHRDDTPNSVVDSHSVNLWFPPNILGRNHTRLWRAGFPLRHYALNPISVRVRHRPYIQNLYVFIIQASNLIFSENECWHV